jgi:hypothetical protein
MFGFNDDQHRYLSAEALRDLQGAFTGKAGKSSDHASEGEEAGVDCCEHHAILHLATRMLEVGNATDKRVAREVIDSTGNKALRVMMALVDPRAQHFGAMTVTLTATGAEFMDGDGNVTGLDPAETVAMVAGLTALIEEAPGARAFLERAKNKARSLLRKEKEGGDE